MEQMLLAAVYCLIRRVRRRMYACTLEIRDGFEAIRILETGIRNFARLEALESWSADSIL